MYMRPSPGPGRYEGLRLSPTAAGTVLVSVLAVIVFGFWPGGLLEAAGQSAARLTQTGLPFAGR
jgi:hypothetical protein